jgi:hypothetical protein
MRERRRNNPRLPCDVQSLPAPAEHVARLFSPSELDLDDLAEAIRSLLGPSSVSPGHPDPDLLPVPRRVTHVVEATEIA